MTAESKNLLQHDAPIIRQASPIEDAPEETSNSNSKTNDKPGPNDKPGRVIEIGGRDGPEPTRYGDWEKGGRCIDF